MVRTEQLSVHSARAIARRATVSQRAEMLELRKDTQHEAGVGGGGEGEAGPEEKGAQAVVA